MPNKLGYLITALLLVTGLQGAYAAHGKEQPVDIKQVETGEGAEAMPYSEIEVHYTGRLSDGKVFDSSVERGEPFRFTLGSGQVIPGWDIGIRGMKPGGKRVLTIPPELAYGPRGAGNVIPPNATLVFEVELLSVKPPAFSSIDNEQLKQKIADGITLIDIRRPEEWQQTGIVEGSIKATAFDAQGRFLQTFLDTLNNTVKPDEEFALICRTGNRTAALSNWLASKGGYDKVLNVRDGIVSWIEQGLPVSK